MLTSEEKEFNKGDWSNLDDRPTPKDLGLLSKSVLVAAWKETIAKLMHSMTTFFKSFPSIKG